MGPADVICTANTAADSDSDSSSDSDSNSDSDPASDHDSGSDSDPAPDYDSGSDDAGSACDRVLESISGMGPADIYKGVFGCFSSYASTRTHASTRAHASASTTATATAVVFISEQLSRRPERVIHGGLLRSPPA